jgi:CBS-domain-containing membrane protein
VEGILLRSDLLAALAQRGQEAPVTEIMRRDFQVVDSSEMLETAFARLQACNCHTIPVTHGGQLVGLVTMDNLGEFMLIQAAMGGPRRLRPATA